MKQFTAAIMCGVLGSCSAGNSGDSARLSPAGRNDPVSITRGTRSFVSPTRQFAAYVPLAERLTIIDQESETEAYGIHFSSEVETVWPVSSFDGVAALTRDGLTVFSAGKSRSFSFPYRGLKDGTEDGSAWDYAVDAPAFAISEGSSGVRVIRHREGDLWQEEVLPGLRSQILDVPVMGPDGTFLMMVQSDTGAYNLYHAPKRSDPMVLKLSCPVLDRQLSFPMAALALVEKRLYWATQTGELGMIDGDMDTCQQPTVRAALPEETDVARLIPLTDGSIFVFAVGGRLFTWDGGSQVTPNGQLGGCGFPLSPVILAEGAMGVLCLQDSRESSNKKNVLYRSAFYRYYEKSSREPKLSIELTGFNLSAVGFDAQSRRLFLLKGSPLGIMTTYELPSGDSREKRGLFLKNILQD